MCLCLVVRLTYRTDELSPRSAAEQPRGRRLVFDEPPAKPVSPPCPPRWSGDVESVHGGSGTVGVALRRPGDGSAGKIAKH